MNGGQTSYSYDSLDNLAQVTDARNLSTIYTLNGFGERLTETSPDSGTTLRQYSAGNLTSQQDARGITQSNTYDALGRLVQRQTTDQTTNYSWDTASNGVGQLAQISDNSGVTQYSYDALGRVAQVQHTPTGQPPLITNYTWNNADQLLSMTLPSGQTLNYNYWNQRLTEIQRNGQAFIGPVYYRPHGVVDGYAYNNGAWHYHSCDLDGRMNGQQAGSYYKSYHYDMAGRLIETTDNAPARSQTYQYDTLDHLIQTIYNNTVWGYGYDANGNRTSSHTAWNPSNYQIAVPVTNYCKKRVRTIATMLRATKSAPGLKVTAMIVKADAPVVPSTA